jgi:hypothetical protein
MFLRPASLDPGFASVKSALEDKVGERWPLYAIYESFDQLMLGWVWSKLDSRIGDSSLSASAE